MQEILTREAIQALYDQGKTEEALEAIDVALHEVGEEEVKALLALEAWCHYRRKDYDPCRVAIAGAMDNVKALECAAQLAAYVDKDDNLLMQIATRLHDNVGVQNAFVIRARDKDSTITHDAVTRSVSRVMGSEEIAATNLINNAGRFFHAKSRGITDLFTAIGLLGVAVLRYGSGDKNLHHRAAVLFWQSKIAEELVGKDLAQLPARQSLVLWDRQVQLDPTNPAFQKGLENAKARLEQLIG